MATEATAYTTLATTASIFLGLLTALIVNQLVDDRAEKSRIHERIRGLTSELDNLQKQRDDLEQYLIDEGEEYGEDLHKRAVNAEIDEFFQGSLAIDRRIPISEFDWERLQEEYEAYTNEELSHWEIFELADRFDEARKIVEMRNLRNADTFRKRVSVGLSILKRWIRQITLLDFILVPEATDDQSPDLSDELRDVMNDINIESVISDRDAEWHRVNSKIKSINAEIDDRWQDYQAVNTEDRLCTLTVIACSTFLSVIIPLVGLLLNVADWTLSVSGPLNHLDLFLIGLFWVSGIALVFNHIYQNIQEELDDEEPDIDRPEITGNKHPHSEERAKQRLREREGMDTDSETVRYVNKSENPKGEDSKSNGG